MIQACHATSAPGSSIHFTFARTSNMLNLSARPPNQRRFFGVMVNGVALLLYLVGLIEPLTPSEGLPSFTAVLIFVGIPVSLLAWCFSACVAAWARIVVSLELLALLGFFVYLLRLQIGV